MIKLERKKNQCYIHIIIIIWDKKNIWRKKTFFEFDVHVQSANPSKKKSAIIRKGTTYNIHTYCM